MKKQVALPLAAVLGGAAAYFLRLRQNRLGFEPDTGLTISDSPYTLVVPVALCALCAALFLLSRLLPGGKEPAGFPAAFPADGLTALALVCGSFAWLISGGLEVLTVLRYTGALSVGEGTGVLLTASGTFLPGLTMASGVLTAAAGCCLLAVAAACRRGGALNGTLTLAPVLVLVVRLVLAYRQLSVDPCLSAYYVELLALVFLILGFYHAAAFAFAAGRTRTFAFSAALCVALCAAALADRPAPAVMALYAGGAAAMLGLLRARLAALPVPEAEVPERPAPEQTSASEPAAPEDSAPDAP